MQSDYKSFTIRVPVALYNALRDISLQEERSLSRTTTSILLLGIRSRRTFSAYFKNNDTGSDLADIVKK